MAKAPRRFVGVDVQTARQCAYVVLDDHAEPLEADWLCGTTNTEIAAALRAIAARHHSSDSGVAVGIRRSAVSSASAAAIVLEWRIEGVMASMSPNRSRTWKALRSGSRGVPRGQSAMDTAQGAVSGLDEARLRALRRSFEVVHGIRSIPVRVVRSPERRQVASCRRTAWWTGSWSKGHAGRICRRSYSTRVRRRPRRIGWWRRWSRRNRFAQAASKRE